MRHRGVVAAVVVASVGALLLGAATPRRLPPPPPPPPPQVTLALDAPWPDRGWTVRLTNTGTDLVRIVADPRLVSFDVTVGGHERHCTLPTEMTPSTDTERTLVVPAGRSWTVRIDPLLYCFSAADAASLTAGATVTANFGWPQGRYAPPFAVTPTTQVDGGVGPARRVSSAAVTLAATVEGDAGATATVDAAAPSDAYPVHLKTSIGDRLDASRAFEQSVTVTIANEGDRPVRTLITPPTIGFYVQTPNGYVIRCGADTALSAIAELTTTLAAHARTAVTVDLGTICGSVMRQPGLYRVRPRLDTRRTAPPIGATTFWAGEAVGNPMLVRIRSGEDPMPNPRLDPAP